MLMAMSFAPFPSSVPPSPLPIPRLLPFNTACVRNLQILLRPAGDTGLCWLGFGPCHIRHVFQVVQTREPDEVGVGTSVGFCTPYHQLPIQCYFAYVVLEAAWLLGCFPARSLCIFCPYT